MEQRRAEADPAAHDQCGIDQAHARPQRNISIVLCWNTTRNLRLLASMWRKSASPYSFTKVETFWIGMNDAIALIPSSTCPSSIRTFQNHVLSWPFPHLLHFLLFAWEFLSDDWQLGWIWETEKSHAWGLQSWQLSGTKKLWNCWYSFSIVVTIPRLHIGRLQYTTRASSENLCEWCQCSEPGMHDQVTRKLINELPEATWSSLESYGNHIVHSLFVEFNVSFVDCGCKNWILPSLGAACVQARHWPPDIHWKIEREAARMGWMNEPTFAQMQYVTISILAKFGFEFWMFWACNSSNLALRQVQEISYFGNYKYSFSNCETDRNSSWTNVQKQRKLKSKKCEASEMLCVDALRKTWTKQWIRKARDTTSRLWTLTLELEG